MNIDTRTICLCFGLVFFVSCPTYAETKKAGTAKKTPATVAKKVVKQGTGLVFGERFSYVATAPKNWALDNKSGARQGIHMLFYPVKYNYQSAPVIVYGRSAALGKHKDPIKAQVNLVLAHLRKHGNPKVRAKYFNTLILPNRKNIVLYRFRGYARGSQEIAAYIREPHSLNFLVFHAQSETAYNKYYKDFEKILLSYKNAYDSQADVDRKKFNQLVAVAKKIAESPSGKLYNKKLFSNYRKSMQNTLRHCTRHINLKKYDKVEFLLQVDKSGKTKKVLAWPLNSVSNCFRILAYTAKHPKHSINNYLFYINLDLKP